MVYLGIVLILAGVLVELAFMIVSAASWRAYRGYGWGLGGLLIVVGIVLVVLGLAGVAV